MRFSIARFSERTIQRIKNNFEYLNISENRINILNQNNAIIFGDILLSAVTNIPIEKFIEEDSNTKILNIAIHANNVYEYISLLQTEFGYNMSSMKIMTITPISNSIFYKKVLCIIDVNEHIKIYVIPNNVSLTNLPKFFSFNYMLYINNKLYLSNDVIADDIVRKRGYIGDSFINRFVSYNEYCIISEYKRYLKLGFDIRYTHPFGEINLVHQNNYNINNVDDIDRFFILKILLKLQNYFSAKDSMQMYFHGLRLSNEYNFKLSLRGLKLYYQDLHSTQDDIFRQLLNIANDVRNEFRRIDTRIYMRMMELLSEYEHIISSFGDTETNYYNVPMNDRFKTELSNILQRTYDIPEDIKIDDFPENPTVYDVIELEDISLKTYLTNDNDNIILIFKNEYDNSYFIKPSKLDRLCDKNNMFVKCNREGVFIPTLETIIDFNKWYVSNIIDDFRIGLSFDAVKSIFNFLNTVDKTNPLTRLFYLDNKEKLSPVSTVRSVVMSGYLNIFNEEINVVSSTHCGIGSNLDVYNVVRKPLFLQP